MNFLSLQQTIVLLAFCIAMLFSAATQLNFDVRGVWRLIRGCGAAALHVSATTDSSIRLLKAGACDIIDQKLHMLRKINSQDYSRTLPSFYNASVGSHFRHSLQHIEAIVRRIEDDHSYNEDVIHYDLRSRNNAVETNVLEAIDVTTALIHRINSLNNIDKSIMVSFMGPKSEQFEPYFVPSTMSRELSFAVHHAFHHVSMIKLMMVEMHYDFSNEPQVGLAPSSHKETDVAKKES
jgi:hypothetical protein